MKKSELANIFKSYNLFQVALSAALLACAVAAPAHPAPAPGYGYQDPSLPPVYNYQYGVEDPHYGPVFSHSENRDNYKSTTPPESTASTFPMAASRYRSDTIIRNN